VKFLNIPSLTPQQQVAFWSKSVVAESGCIEWAGAYNEGGYGVTRIEGATRYYAHRVAYADSVGAVPAGLVLDHLCRNTKCVNPTHLEPVSVRTNTVRGDNFKGANTGLCGQGHPESDIDYRDGRPRRCKSCHRDYMRAHMARKQAERKANALATEAAHVL
jgi:hypothetical protein